jgi:SagB-type dehydrogenase family enzyme
MSTELEVVLRYHEASKHHFHQYAPGPGHLEWSTQPDPFRRYAGAPLLPLELIPPGTGPRFEPAFLEGELPAATVDHHSLSQLFFDSLSISAWKEAGDNRWALRVNPSSGNLHPTEAYLVAGPIPGLSDTAGVYHYAAREHALEQRACLTEADWARLSAGFPAGTLFVGLSSIHWREAWKYGLRAFRYCQHDVGHALGALAVAAAGLGWIARLVENLSTPELGELLGLASSHGLEVEHPDCLVAICPPGPAGGDSLVPVETGQWTWNGTPNVLSPGHVDWGLAEVAGATHKPRTDIRRAPASNSLPRLCWEPSSVYLREVVRRRRSAVAMDAHTGITREAFYQILRKTLPGPDQVPFTLLPWQPRVHLLLFVHRVAEVDPGLYLLVRDTEALEELHAQLSADFAWEQPEGCPDGIQLHRLVTGDARRVAAQVSCGQDIAADGCFSVAMLADFERPLSEVGPWVYPRLYWECGLIGQVLYLEAEASGIRATGIGCYFDDPVHDLLGLTGRSFQDLYHFTLGGPIDDSRLTTLPAYPAPD